MAALMGSRLQHATPQSLLQTEEERKVESYIQILSGSGVPLAGVPLG